METETWIERLLLNQLTTHDRRYKHDYAGVEKTTDDLVAACTHFDTVIADGTFDRSSLEQLLSTDTAFEPEVEVTLDSLQDRGLIECVGERDRPGPPFEPGADGTTAVWNPTVAGRAEASAIHKAYAAEVETLVNTHGEGSEAFREAIVSVAKTYGILPSPFG